MINLNGTIIQNPDAFTTNRSFLYADALFDTLLFQNGKIIFAEAHYFRLLSSMRQLRMEIPPFFTQDFWETEIHKTIQINTWVKARVRTTIYRDSIGLYKPDSNTIGFVIQVSPIHESETENYKLGIYKDNFLNTNSLDNLKTTSRLINVLASIYVAENHLDNCVLLNHKKQVACAMNSNLFMVNGNTIKTPALTEGCINGITRQKLIQILSKSADFQLIETEILPFELQNSDEIFLTNSIMGIQSITEFKKKTFSNTIGNILQKELDKLSN